ncbi:MAG TPA: sigma-70 family RNA polymerase sigma factor [Chthonomonadaceae bacterium]|nr:sigma-70 family RNA polymerase sigma factor [Chthonomonadaceae bacterium]
MDPLLLPYLQATEEAEERRLLMRLIEEHADPAARSIVRRHLRASLDVAGKRFQGEEAPEAEDVCAQVRMELLHRLKQLKNDPNAEPIHYFRSYAARVAYHACAHRLQSKYPHRQRLKKSLCHLLSYRPDLALWKGQSGGWLCGFACWQEAGAEPFAAARYEALLNDPGAALAEAQVSYADLAAAAAAVFAWVGCPIALEDLVAVLAEWTGADTQVAVVFDSRLEGEADEEAITEISDARQDVTEEVSAHLYLEQVWAELQPLPLHQRRVFLLSFEEIALLPVAGIASLDEIARMLEMSSTELARLWNDLPLEDLAIAGRLGMTRQQVINKRKSARERLGRRLRDWQW